MNSDPTPLVKLLTEVDAANKRAINLSQRLAALLSEAASIQKQIAALRK